MNLSDKALSRLLFSLFLLDMVLSGVSLLFPQTWFLIFHDRPYIDPQGLLRRTGGTWLAFSLLQLLAYRRWKENPHWLMLIAGVRLSDIFSDAIYLAIAEHVTFLGKLGLLIAPPSNLWIGWVLWRAYLRRRKTGHSVEVPGEDEGG